MRNFIKQEIQSRMDSTAKNNAPESVPNDTILEYSSLFQELDELSPEGTQAGETRKLSTDIPLLKDEEDSEIEKIEFDLGTGNVDVNKDATVDSVTESYAGIKSYEEFYQEAAEAIVKLPRESEEMHERRVTEYADKLYNEYCEEAAECGYFGFDKINITDAKVPSKMNVNFGAMSAGSSDNFVTKVNTFFATDENHNITKKQLDSVQLVKMGALKKIGEPLKAYMESTYNVDSDTSVWDVCTPKTLIVPKGNGDSFCVVVEYTNEITGKNEYYGWTAPVTDKDENITMESCEKFNMESFATETHYENKDVVVQEMADLEATKEAMRARRVRRGRFYQEAIEGAADTTTDVSTDAPAAEGDAPAAEGTDAAATDTTVDTSTEGTEGGEKETAAVNDVSSEIADKVAADTQSDAMSDDETITFSDETNPTDNVGVADLGDVDETSVEGEDAGVEGGDEAATDDADAALNELDDAVSDTEDVSGEDLDESEEDEGALDVDNVDDMSVNQLLELGKESLKDMKVGDLKNLIANGKDEEIQEAFIYTSKNINKELDIKLRECLGILNDNKDNADQILVKFKTKGHKLNRALSKAAGMKKVYSSDEIQAIKDLNEALAQLLLVLRKKPENYGSMIKGKIMDFTKEAKKVGRIIEDKLGKGGGVEEVTQEAFLLNNINDKLTKALIPVKADMSDLNEKYQAGQLTRGRLMKKYAAGTGRSVISEKDAFSFMSGNLHVKNLDTALKFLNKALRKNVENSDLIEKLADKIDLLTDYIETVIDDSKSVDMKPYIEIIGKTAGEIVELIDQFIGDDSANITPGEEMMGATENGLGDEGALDEDINNVDEDTLGDGDEEVSDDEPEEDESSDDDDDDKDEDKDEEGEDE